jgi:integrase/recombinase XerD
VFPGPRGDALGRDAVRRLVQRHANSAAAHCSSLASKIVSPHTLRHTCAMRLLEAGKDPSTIAFWLESPVTTQIYLHAHLALKERAIARTAPTNTTIGRYHPPDRLIALLEQL